MRHRLTFRQADLELVATGQKTATIRFSTAAERVKEGDALTLAFGRRDRPTLLEAVAVRVLTFDLLEPMVALGNRLERDPDAVLEPSAATCDPEFLTALGSSYSVLDDVLSEAAERDQQFCSAIFWRLTPSEKLAEAA